MACEEAVEERLYGLRSDGFIADLKRGREARIAFHDGSRRRIAVPLSLLGFTAGFNTLAP